MTQSVIKSAHLSLERLVKQGGLIDSDKKALLELKSNFDIYIQNNMLDAEELNVDSQRWIGTLLALTMSTITGFYESNKFKLAKQLENKVQEPLDTKLYNYANERNMHTTALRPN